MKLRKPAFPDLTATGLYYATQAGHRKIAIDLVFEAIKALSSNTDPVLGQMSEALREWTIEAVVQGAWIREYHKWETDTKSYFGTMHIRNNIPYPNWKKIEGSHVWKIEQELALFSATPPPSVTVIDSMRSRVNNSKHEESYLATPADYEALVVAVGQFWQDLDVQELFTPP